MEQNNNIIEKMKENIPKVTEIIKENIGLYVSLNQSVLDNLEKEVMELGKKLEKTRSNEDYTTYKNLIVSYKEVIRLRQEIKMEIEKEENKKRESMKSKDTVDSFIKDFMSEDKQKEEIAYLELRCILSNCYDRYKCNIYYNNEIITIKSRGIDEIIDRICLVLPKYAYIIARSNAEEVYLLKLKDKGYVFKDFKHRSIDTDTIDRKTSISERYFYNSDKVFREKE